MPEGNFGIFGKSGAGYHQFQGGGVIALCRAWVDTGNGQGIGDDELFGNPPGAVGIRYRQCGIILACTGEGMAGDHSFSLAALTEDPCIHGGSGGDTR